VSSHRVFFWFWLRRRNTCERAKEGGARPRVYVHRFRDLFSAARPLILLIAEPTPCPEPYAESAPLLRPRPRPNPPFVDTPATLKKLKPLAGVPGTNEMQRLSRELLSREMLSREGLLRQLGHHRLPPPTCSPLRGLPKSRSTGMLSLAPLVDGGRARLIEREDIDPRPLNKAKILVTKSRSRHDCHTGLHESWSDAKREAKRPQMLPVSEGDPRPRTPHTFRGALWNPATNRHQ